MAGEKPKQEKIVFTEARLVLNEEKLIRGRKIKAGTVLAEVKCVEGFNIEDVDLGVQLGQLKIDPMPPKK